MPTTRNQPKTPSPFPEQLSDGELIGLILHERPPRQGVLEFEKLPNLEQLRLMDSLELLGEPGHQDPQRAYYLALILELGRRLASRPLPVKRALNAPEVVFEHFGPLLSQRKQESFWVLALNNANHLIDAMEISRGVLNSCLVHPREVFRYAIIRAAANIILVHNHPSGEVIPSAEDHNITKRLKEAGELISIKVLDHVIIGRNGYFSFREGGVM
ncbi:MAG TPA: DNA repair protein RadC [Calditrichia bacterium]|nr:DNA repair protein RadC [Calditrichota bacterium]HQU73779.1 DNA repair protein RadC [Calditrichia bacterium]HQV32053.1 DNA repair protein RadC [Calditrichia bacterium]